MGLDKADARHRIVAEMDGAAVPAVIRSRDFRDGTIDGAGRDLSRRSRNDGAGGWDLVRGPDLDVVGPAIYGIDDEVMPVIDLVGASSWKSARGRCCSQSGNEREDAGTKTFGRRVELQ